jgi:transposase
LDDPRQTREQVTLGVDTHAELHVAAALDERGRLLGTCTIPTTATGFAELVRWTGQ